MHFSLFRASLGLCCWMTAAFAQIPQQAPASGGIAGIVLDANNVPVRRAIITLSTVETPPQDAVAWSDANGRFSFSNVPAGRYQLRASGYPLDSAGPNSLWLGAHLDQRRISSRRSVDGLLHEPEKQFPAALRSPAVEAECELVKVVWQLPGSHRALVGSEQPALQQRGDSVDAR